MRLSSLSPAVERASTARLAPFRIIVDDGGKTVQLRFDFGEESITIKPESGRCDADRGLLVNQLSRETTVDNEVMAYAVRLMAPGEVLGPRIGLCIDDTQTLSFAISREDFKALKEYAEGDRL